jgi:hypothetical protein
MQQQFRMNLPSILRSQSRGALFILKNEDGESHAN